MTGASPKLSCKLRTALETLERINPLFATLGVAKRLVEEYLIRVESGSEFSASAETN